jgi:hypothetical protein
MKHEYLNYINQIWKIQKIKGSNYNFTHLKIIKLNYEWIGAIHNTSMFTSTK